jgi:hypothetical protein
MDDKQQAVAYLRQLMRSAKPIEPFPEWMDQKLRQDAVERIERAVRLWTAANALLEELLATVEERV